MAFDQSTRGSADTLRLTRGEKLSAIERIVVLVIVTITVATDLTPADDPLTVDRDA